MADHSLASGNGKRDCILVDRRAVLLGAGSVVTTAVTGCVGGGSVGDGESFTKESNGELRHNRIDEFEILGWTSAVNGDNFEVNIKWKNTADTVANIFEYNVDVIAYDEEGTELDFTDHPTEYPEEREQQPDGVGTVRPILTNGPDPNTVASYEIAIDCSTDFDSGKFCPSSG